MFSRCVGFTSLLLLAILPLLLASEPLSAQTNFRVVHAFTGSDGSQPYGGLFRDAGGNLYGTTLLGGNTYGTVFKIDPSGNLTNLYTFLGFSGDDGYPYGGVVQDASGNIFGTDQGIPGTSQQGLIFKLNSTNQLSVIHYFHGYSEGAYPDSDLVMDNAGNTYGTTIGGGSQNCGTLFKVDSTGFPSTLHSFFGATNPADGCKPYGKPYVDAAGNVIGTTFYGGTYGVGCVYKVAPKGKITIIYSFPSGFGGDAKYPHGGLVRDSKGNYWGTTEYGGMPGSGGYGTVFKITPAGQESVVHAFTPATDGNTPIAGLAIDTQDNVYGVTNLAGPSGFGTVFKLTPAGQFSVLHSFDYQDGANPVGLMVVDPNGNVFGTTEHGGSFLGGEVFELSY